MANILPRFLNFTRFSLNKFQNFPNQPRFANSLIDTALKCSYSSQPTPYEIVDEGREYKQVKDTLYKVNDLIAKSKQGRLFSVVHVAGKQHKVTEGDVIIVEGYWPPECGEKILLNKVLLAGAESFTLVGRPIIQEGLVNVQATVIEKTLSHTKTHFRKKRRKQYTRIHFYKIPQTFLRINSISVSGEVGNPPEVRGLDKVVF